MDQEDFDYIVDHTSEGEIEFGTSSKKGSSAWYCEEHQDEDEPEETIIISE